MIEEAIEDFRIAMKSADAETLRNLTAKELSYGHANGLVEDQEEFIRAIGTRDEFKEITITDLILASTDTHTVVRHRFQAIVYVNGIEARPDIRVLQVWIKREGKWKLLVRQGYRV